MINLEKGVVVDFSGSLAEDVAKKGIKRCCEKCNISPEMIIPIIKDPFLEDYLSSEMVADCHQIFREEIENAKPDPNVLKAMLYCQDKNYKIFISSNGFADAIEKALEKSEFSDLTVTLVFGREDGIKKEHIEKIRRIYDLEEIIIFGDDPSDFQNTGDFKVALNPSGKNPERFLGANVDRIINVPLTIEIVREFVR